MIQFMCFWGEWDTVITYLPAFCLDNFIFHLKVACWSRVREQLSQLVYLPGWTFWWIRYCLYHHQQQSTTAHSSLKEQMQVPVLDAGFGRALGTLSPECTDAYKPYQWCCSKHSCPAALVVTEETRQLPVDTETSCPWVLPSGQRIPGAGKETRQKYKG